MFIEWDKQDIYHLDEAKLEHSSFGQCHSGHFSLYLSETKLGCLVRYYTHRSYWAHMLRLKAIFDQEKAVWNSILHTIFSFSKASRSLKPQCHMLLNQKKIWWFFDDNMCNFPYFFIKAQFYSIVLVSNSDERPKQFFSFVKRIWYLSPMRAAKVQASLRIRAVSPEPPLLAHTSSELRGTLRQKARSLAPLNGWTCAVKICHGGMLEDTNSLDESRGSAVIMLLSMLPNRDIDWYEHFLWALLESKQKEMAVIIDKETTQSKF